MIISFDHEDGRFNLRAAGVAVRPRDGKILFHRTAHDNFWSLPGGRCDFHESAPEALAREMREEIGVSGRVEVGRLLFVAETFYTYLGRRYHEIGLYFLLAFPEDARVYEADTFPGHEPGLPLIYAWLDPQTSGDGRLLFPTFLPAALTSPLPDAPRHFVHTEPEGIPGNPRP